jgi:hypothetical protein
MMLPRAATGRWIIAVSVVSSSPEMAKALGLTIPSSLLVRGS